MELQYDNKTIYYNSNNYDTTSTHSKQSKPECETENQYEEVYLRPSKPAIHDTRSADDTAQMDYSRWRERLGKHLIGAVAVGASVCLIVWITAAVFWIGKDISQTSYTSQNRSNDKHYSQNHTHGDSDTSPFTYYTHNGTNHTHVRHESFIGFTAWAQEPIHYNAGDIVNLTRVLVNAGGLYNATGHFSCDIGGLYYVAVTLKRMPSVSDMLMIMVYKGDEEIMFVQDHDSNNPGMSVTIDRLVLCYPGEYLVMRGFNTGSVYGEPGGPHSTFTAFLIHETGTTMMSQSSIVGFSAAKASGQHYGNGDAITFTNVLYNEGGHFIPATNRFLCPVSGLYYVSVALRKQHNVPLNVCVTNPQSQLLLHSVNSDTHNWFSTTSNTAVIRCQQRDSIAVEGTGPGEMGGRHNYQTTIFTAMLLHADVEPGHATLVAFSVYKKNTQPYTEGDVIRFDGEIMNEGNYFGANSFVCQTTGIFYISLNAKKAGVNPLSLDVKVQMVTVLRLESIAIKNPSNTFSGSVLVRCLSNEVIQVTGAAWGEVFGDKVERHTTFSVIMMYQD